MDTQLTTQARIIETKSTGSHSNNTQSNNAIVAKVLPTDKSVSAKVIQTSAEPAQNHTTRIKLEVNNTVLQLSAKFSGNAPQPGTTINVQRSESGQIQLQLSAPTNQNTLKPEQLAATSKQPVSNTSSSAPSNSATNPTSDAALNKTANTTNANTAANTTLKASVIINASGNLLVSIEKALPQGTPIAAKILNQPLTNNLNQAPAATAKSSGLSISNLATNIPTSTPTITPQVTSSQVNQLAAKQFTAPLPTASSNTNTVQAAPVLTSPPQPLPQQTSQTPASQQPPAQAAGSQTLSQLSQAPQQATTIQPAINPQLHPTQTIIKPGSITTNTGQQNNTQSNTTATQTNNPVLANTTTPVANQSNTVQPAPSQAPALNTPTAQQSTSTASNSQIPLSQTPTAQGVTTPVSPGPISPLPNTPHLGHVASLTNTGQPNTGQSTVTNNSSLSTALPSNSVAAASASQSTHPSQIPTTTSTSGKTGQISTANLASTSTLINTTANQPSVNNPTVTASAGQSILNATANLPPVPNSQNPTATSVLTTNNHSLATLSSSASNLISGQFHPASQVTQQPQNAQLSALPSSNTTIKVAVAGQTISLQAPANLPPLQHIQITRTQGTQAQIQWQQPAQQLTPVTSNFTLTPKQVQLVDQQLRLAMPQQIPMADGINQLVAQSAQLAQSTSASNVNTQIDKVALSIMHMFGVKPGNRDSSDTIKRNIQQGGLFTENKMASQTLPQQGDLKSFLSKLSRLADQLPTEQREMLHNTADRMLARVTSNQLTHVQQQLAHTKADISNERNFQIDIPVVHNEKLDNVEMEIKQRKHLNEEGDYVSIWSVKLHFDLQERGEVDAEVALNPIDNSISTTFLCTHLETVREIEHRMQGFRKQLHTQGFEIQTLHCTQGSQAANKQNPINKRIIDIRT